MTTSAKHQDHNPFATLEAMDEILLDVATVIELSPADRRVAGTRYRKLKLHLERSGSSLAPYMIDGRSLIYAQGSIATNTTIISGIEDDRFDVDAVAEIEVPLTWDDQRPLDELEASLQSFPGVDNIVRCTRCVQLQFPFMHMDVTVLDRRAQLIIPRAGQIFHSPDEGQAYRVDSNPWGFTDWYRARVGKDQAQFVEMLEKRRALTGRSRLTTLDEMESLAKADQVGLPPVIPTRLDAQESVALKLLKRNLNIEYESGPLKRPPSIYLTKRTGDFGFHPAGLTAQLHGLARFIAADLREHITRGTRPVEVNPSYPADRINDRWPRAGAAGETDMKMLASALEKLAARLEEAARAPMDRIVQIVDELFGERVGAEQRRILKERYQREATSAPSLIKPRTGQITAPAIVRPREDARPIRSHNFHCGVLPKKK